MAINFLDHITTKDEIWRPYAHEHVTVCEYDKPLVSFLETCYSEFSSGPNLRELAEATFRLIGRGGYFGFYSSKNIPPYRGIKG